MNQFKKGIIAMGLALILCMNSVMPVRAAAGSVCPSCGGTRTSAIYDEMQEVQEKQICIHGYNGFYDTVVYHLYYEMVYCNDCKAAKAIRMIRREFVSRTCPIV